MSHLKKIPKIHKNISKLLSGSSKKINSTALIATGISVLLLCPKTASGVFRIEINGILGDYNDSQEYTIGGSYTCPAVSRVVNGHFSTGATSGTTSTTMKAINHGSHGSHGQW